MFWFIVRAIVCFDVVGCPMHNAFQAFPDVRAVAVENKVVAVTTGGRVVNA